MAGRILEGIRVLDFTVVWAGPYAARMLAEMGAEVIRVEHPRLRGVTGNELLGSPAKMARALGMESPEVDPNIPAAASEATWQGVRDSWTAAFSANKRFIALDTTKPEGLEVLHNLIKIIDVCIENLTPDVVRKIGIDYEHLREFNPRLICCMLRGFGRGPWEDYGAYGNTMEYLSGITSLTGYGYQEGDQPMRAGIFTADPVGAMHAVAATISALRYRKRTGKGMKIEVRQYEGVTSFVSEAVMDYVMNKRVRTPIGNNDRHIAFQGCYPAQGDDQWLVISINNKPDWAKLCGIIGKREWLDDEQFHDPSRLEANRKEVDAAITSWTTKRSKEEASRFLQNLNIPAAPVNNTVETIYYPLLRHRGLYKWIEHPYGAIAPTPRMPANFTKTPLLEAFEPARAVGADNHYVYHDLLGLSESRIKALEDKKIITK